jgi:hypothetical protein
VLDTGDVRHHNTARTARIWDGVAKSPHIATRRVTGATRSEIGGLDQIVILSTNFGYN